MTIEETIEEQKPDVVIIDPLSETFTRKEEPRKLPPRIITILGAALLATNALFDTRHVPPVAKPRPILLPVKPEEDEADTNATEDAKAAHRATWRKRKGRRK